MGEQRRSGVTAPERRGPEEGERWIGYDRDPVRRPGVPMARPPEAEEAVAGRALSLQEDRRDEKLHRSGLDGPTPVYGTAQPRHGLSGALRRAAYEVPEHHMRHWMMLMLADRTDVLEHRVGSRLARPLDVVGADAAAGGVRARPWIALGVLVGGVWLARRWMA